MHVKSFFRRTRKVPETASQLPEASDEQASVIEQTLADFRLSGRIVKADRGPSCVRYALELAPGVNVARLQAIQDNLALALKTRSVRLEVPIPGTDYVGIEVPIDDPRIVSFHEVMGSSAMENNSSPTLFAVGQDVTNQPVVCDLADMPHLLVAGRPGSGKSVFIHTLICSILRRATPQQVRLLLIDPKLTELSCYNGVPHLLCDTICDSGKAILALSWVVQEMEARYRLLWENGKHSIREYNASAFENTLPYIVVIIDEFSDLMMTGRQQAEALIQQIAAKARAAGIHLVLATQHPSVNVVTGIIRCNFPSRVSFALSNEIDSRTLLQCKGAERLLGRGDMLYMPRSEFHPIRVQGCHISPDDIHAVIQSVKEANLAPCDTAFIDFSAMTDTAPEASGETLSDTPPTADLLRAAVDVACEAQQISTSMLRRRLNIGYARAGRLLDELERMGVIGAAEDTKPRPVLLSREECEKLLQNE